MIRWPRRRPPPTSPAPVPAPIPALSPATGLPQLRAAVDDLARGGAIIDALRPGAPDWMRSAREAHALVRSADASLRTTFGDRFASLRLQTDTVATLADCPRDQAEGYRATVSGRLAAALAEVRHELLCAEHPGLVAAIAGARRWLGERGLGYLDVQARDGRDGPELTVWAGEGRLVASVPGDGRDEPWTIVVDGRPVETRDVAGAPALRMAGADPEDDAPAPRGP